MTKELSKWLETLPEAKINTSSIDIKKRIMELELDEDEILISLDVKSLYTNVPVLESIRLATQLAYEQETTPDMEPEVFSRLLKLATNDVYLLHNGTWFRQTDGLAMGSKLALFLANIWMSSFEDEIAGKPSLQDSYSLSQERDDQSNIRNPCGACGNAVRGNSAQCRRCAFWYHRDCAGLTNRELKRLKPGTWHCGCGGSERMPPTNLEPITEAKLCVRYVDDILRTAKAGEVDTILLKVNQLHPKLEFTIERESEQKIAFLDLALEHIGNRVTSSWYKKPTDTGLCLNYRACAPKKYKRNLVEGTIHRINHTTSSWSAFDAGLKKWKEEMERNQYPPSFYEDIVKETVTKIIEGRNAQAKSKSNEGTGDRGQTEKPILLVQYRGHITDIFSKRLRKTAPISVIHTTRKLRSALPSLKSPVSKELRSRVVYQIECSGCNSRYVGQTVRHLQTRLTEHLRAGKPVGEHIRECTGDINNHNARILDQCNDSNKLLTLEALHISRLKPGLNAREEYRQRVLTIKL